MDDNQSLRTPVLDSHAYNGFKPLKTIWIVFCLIFMLLIVELVILFYVFIYTTDTNMKCDLFELAIYAEISMWTMFFIIRFYINRKHKLGLMARGYFQFYETASCFIELPFYISCCWLCILLVVTLLYTEEEVNRNFCDTTAISSPLVVVTIVISLQNAILIPLFSVYIMKVYEYNKHQSPPDSENGNQWMPNALRETLSSGEMGYRERCEVIDNMLEKQADLIRYYKEANEVLNKKIFDLTSQSRTVFDN